MVYKTIIKPKYELLRIKCSSHDFPVHFHKKICIGKVVSGERCIKTINQENIISKNGMYIIPPYVAHSCKANGDNDYLIFSFDTNEINNPEIISEGAKYLETDSDKIIKLMDYARNSGIENNRIINYIMDYFEEYHNCKIKINDLANKLGYNKYYILHLFKEKTGISLHQYIIQLKIKYSKHRNIGNNLLDIALENGFFDQSHFIRYFKRYEGITPKEYFRSKVIEYGQYCTPHN